MHVETNVRASPVAEEIRPNISDFLRTCSRRASRFCLLECPERAFRRQTGSRFEIAGVVLSVIPILFACIDLPKPGARRSLLIFRKRAYIDKLARALLLQNRSSPRISSRLPAPAGAKTSGSSTKTRHCTLTTRPSKNRSSTTSASRTTQLSLRF